MSPKKDEQMPETNEAKPDVTVDIPHDEKPSEPAEAEPAPVTAPPLPVPEPLPAAAPEPETAPAQVHEFHEFHEIKDRRWPLILGAAVLAFLVALAVVLAGRWIYHRSVHHTAKTSKPTTAESNKSTASAAAGSQQSNAAGTSSNPASGAGKTQTVQMTPASQLPNNGPGNVIAIFVGTALAVSGLHFIYNLRKS